MGFQYQSGFVSAGAPNLKSMSSALSNIGGKDKGMSEYQRASLDLQRERLATDKADKETLKQDKPTGLLAGLNAGSNIDLSITGDVTKDVKSTKKIIDATNAGVMEKEINANPKKYLQTQLTPEDEKYQKRMSEIATIKDKATRSLEKRKLAEELGYDSSEDDIGVTKIAKYIGSGVNEVFTGLANSVGETVMYPFASDKTLAREHDKTEKNYQARKKATTIDSPDAYLGNIKKRLAKQKKENDVKGAAQIRLAEKLSKDTEVITKVTQKDVL